MLIIAIILWIIASTMITVIATFLDESYKNTDYDHADLFELIGKPHTFKTQVLSNIIALLSIAFAIIILCIGLAIVM